ncbi:MAG TPA: hypothetical protein VG815_12035, partial [Chloroflexota bacterium]|nr:hypothetical protein [Chloroflexota bacterium]
MKPNNPIETPLISPDVATLIPYQMARRLSVAAVSATQTEVTVLMQRADDAATIAEVQSATGRTVVPIEAPKEEIESLLDHLSGTLNTDDLWLQQRHIAALGRLVDHGVNIGQGESVRSLVDRALEFAPYSAEVWLMKARVAVHRQDVVDALTVASQIAPNDRRILRWIQSLQDLDDDHVQVSTPDEAPTIEAPAVESASVESSS